MDEKNKRELFGAELQRVQNSIHEKMRGMETEFVSRIKEQRDA